MGALIHGSNRNHSKYLTQKELNTIIDYIDEGKTEMTHNKYLSYTEISNSRKHLFTPEAESTIGRDVATRHQEQKASHESWNHSKPV